VTNTTARGWRLGRTAVMLLALLLTAACSSLDNLGPDDRGEFGTGSGTHALTTDSASYLLTPDWVGLKTTIGIRFENRSDRTMYIVNCRGGLAPVLQKRVSGQWVEYWSPVVLMCLSPPIVIEPGAHIERSLPIWGALPGNNAAPEWRSPDVPGTYRMVLGSVVWNYSDRGQSFGDPVPLELRVSNEFTLRR
jgi:hypothetical protein